MNQVNLFSCHSNLVKNEIALKFNFFDAYLFEIITDCKIDMSCKAKKIFLEKLSIWLKFGANNVILYSLKDILKDNFILIY